MPFASNNGTQIHYQEHGTGPTVILHHGIGQTGDTWHLTGLVKALSSRFRLVLMDVRGHGRSDKPLQSAAYGWPELIGDILAVADAIQVERINLLGYSMGGLSAYVLAMTVPERVQSLIIGAAGAAPNDYSPFDPVDGTDPAAFLDALQTVLGEALPPDIGQAIVQSNDLPAISAMFSERNAEPDLSTAPERMTMPCLAWAGERDIRFNTTRETIATVPKAEFIPMRGANHLQAFARCGELADQFSAFLEQHAT